MKAERWHGDRAAITVIPGIVDVLHARSYVNSAPNVRGVVGFHDVFTAITKCAITEQETESAIGEVNLMIFADAIGDYGQACAVEAPMPQPAFGAQASCKSLIDFCVGKRLGLSVIPPKTAERREIAREILLQVDAKTVFARDVPRMVRNVRPGNKSPLELGYRVSINSHVCVVRKSQYANRT